jgi:hypothetical protein
LRKGKKTKKQKTKKKQNQKHLPHFEEAAGCKQPPFQVAAAARQRAATQPEPAATVAKLPPFAAAAGAYRQMPRW